MGLSHCIPALDISLLYTVSFIRPLLSCSRWVSRCMHDCLTVTLGVVAFIAFFIVSMMDTFSLVIWSGYYVETWACVGMVSGILSQAYVGLIRPWQFRSRCVDSIICAHFRAFRRRVLSPLQGRSTGGRYTKSDSPSWAWGRARRSTPLPLRPNNNNGKSK